MRDNEGFEIRVNGVPRTFRDLKEPAHEAARVIKNKVPGDIVEIVALSTGTKVVMMADGRTA
jgi:hypothetical protein